MSEKKSVHITLRMPLLRRAEFAVACDVLDATMSKKLHRAITETIQAAKKECPNFDELVQAQMNPTSEPDDSAIEGDGAPITAPSQPAGTPYGYQI